MRSSLTAAVLSSSFLLLTGCATRAQVRQAIHDDPSLVFDAISQEPEKFMTVVQQASIEARKRSAARQLDEEFKNPRVPKIDSSRAIRGNPAAPITLVEYSDFQCPFCKQGFDNVEILRAKYGDKMRVVYKHLPLSMHPMAMPAARYFEAIALQDAKKAYEFHDIVFSNQDDLIQQKEAFLKSTVKKLGLDEKKISSDAESDVVKNRIDADTQEANNFGINGTPGFLINGVVVAGAQPAPQMEAIVDRWLAQIPAK